RYKRAETPSAMDLTARDEEMVAFAYEHHFVTQEQFQAWFFKPSSASSCRHRLTLLHHNAYLDRRLIPLRSAFGANRAAYCLDRRGAGPLMSFRFGDVFICARRASAKFYYSL